MKTKYQKIEAHKWKITHHPRLSGCDFLIKFKSENITTTRSHSKKFLKELDEHIRKIFGK
jgi:hypothetical protein